MKNNKQHKSIIMLYDNYLSLFPPRPVNVVSPQNINTFDNETYIAEPKLNGDCAVIYTNGEEIKILDRHKNQFKKNIDPLKEISKNIHKSNNNEWQVIVGEYMIKSKKDGFENIFNKKFVIHDILVHNGIFLIQYSFSERLELLHNLFPSVNYDGYINKINENLFVVKAFEDKFEDVYNEIINIDMYEGLILKNKSAKLEIGISQTNNSNTQIKIRKPTKNYHY